MFRIQRIEFCLPNLKIINNVVINKYSEERFPIGELAAIWNIHTDGRTNMVMHAGSFAPISKRKQMKRVIYAKELASLLKRIILEIRYQHTVRARKRCNSMTTF